MRAERIIVTSKPGSLLIFKVISVVLGLVVIPLVLVVGLLAVLLEGIRHFVVHKILKWPKARKTPDQDEVVLFHNDKMRLLEKPIEYGSEVDRTAKEFILSIVNYDDEMHVCRIFADEEELEIHNTLITGFKLQDDDELFFQRIVQGVGEPHSDLISVSKRNGRIQKIADVGRFSLHKFSRRRNEIIGYGKKDKIRIKVTDFIPAED